MIPDLPVFLDVEASGIAAGSFPIEIGLAGPRIAGDGRVELVLRSHLVRPADAWLGSASAWDSAAEPVHGLSRSVLLEAGEPIDAVCDALDVVLSGRIVCTDTGGAGWDADWLSVLYEAAGRAPRGWALSEQTAGAVIAARFRERDLTPRIVRPPLARWAPPATHAAAEDALRYAWEWAMAAVLAEAGLGRLAPAESTAALDDLPSLAPRETWPRISPDSEGRFRRR
ncbi:hypothetical protein [Muricoccus radiodurans]|uniref:hypothetical protein n=1 Tax=Muricoccus radiodurans TaxID=2231721 RepID=UPI003CEAC356